MQSIGSAHSIADGSYGNTAGHSSNNNSNSNSNRDFHHSYSYDDNIATPEHQPRSGPGSENSSSHGTPFFADMTLDISVAHDIAETPEAVTRKTFDPDRPVVVLPDVPPMPTLSEFQNGQVPVARQQSLLSQRTEKSYAQTQGSTYNNNNNNNNNNNDGEIRNDGHHQPQLQQHPGINGNWRTRLRRKQWPKDISWAVAFWTIVPIGLLGPLLRATGTGTGSSPSSEASWLAAATSPRSATLHTLAWGLIVAAGILPRLLYRTSGGVGPGDDARHFASQVLLVSAPVSACVYLGLFAGTYLLIPNALWPYGLIPLWYLARDLYLFGRWKMTSTTPGGRQAFFQAIACAALDILSRSLKRKVFYRAVVIVILGQFGVIALWRLSLLAALRSGSLAWAIVAFVGGKWASGTVARLLTLTACGGVSNWFAEQSEQSLGGNCDSNGNVNVNGYGNTSGTPRGGQNPIEDSMPEAYRMADASQYKSTVHTGVDGDFESDDDDDDRRRRRQRERHQRRERRNARSSTVHQLVASGLTVSFGSVAKCGLLGGLAQFVWSQIRKIDHARATLGGMRGMPIGRASASSAVSGSQLLLQRTNAVARNFVRTHSDMAMSYVADYQMSYTRAAQEVAILVDEAGVEPIIHDDISTHMSACVGGSVSGVIILFTGAILVHQRNRNDPGVPDSAVALDMVIAFFFCYTLIFTVMEPLRASIKAVYVCFAQHPEALSQAYPLIFHRLSRMSLSNLQ
eukprot:jgi/Psemu1/257199/estExt_Genewise1Plus.C_2130008